jgi:hypothetical protein
MSGLEIILPLVFASISAAAGAGDIVGRLKSDKTASSVWKRTFLSQSRPRQQKPRADRSLPDLGATETPTERQERAPDKDHCILAAIRCAIRHAYQWTRDRFRKRGESMLLLQWLCLFVICFESTVRFAGVVWTNEH